MNIICLSKENFFSRRRARKQLLFEALSRREEVNKIVYVNAAQNFWIPKEPTTEKSKKIEVVDRFQLLPGERYNWVRKINRQAFYLKLKAIIQTEKKWCTIFYHPLDIDLALRLKSHGKIFFDWTEDWQAYYGIDWLGALQDLSIRSADGVTAVTRELSDRAEKITTKAENVMFLPNASAFPVSAISDGKKEISGDDDKFIGFAGHCGPWFDSLLIKTIALKKPNWQWRFYGRAEPDVADELKEIKSVQFLGPQPFEKLPELLCECSVLIAPYKINFSGDATKLYDYLTLNLPIVSSDIETARRLGPGVRIAKNAEEWIDAIERSMAGQPDDGLEPGYHASQHNWDNRAESMINWLSALN